MSLPLLTMEYIQATYERLLVDESISPAVAAVLALKPEDVNPSLLHDGERGLPAEPRFFDSGYYRMMIGRYLFAGSQFCMGANVLDSCCGMGWGSFLVAQFAKQVVAFDIDPASIAFAQQTWPRQNIQWRCDDALAPDLLGPNLYDVVLAMETVEHFTATDAATYVARMSERLKPGGIFAGTSAFPATRAEADAIAARNQYHPHIFTESEFLTLAGQHFSHASVIANWMFVAVR